jgi:hypothetical protein
MNRWTRFELLDMATVSGVHVLNRAIQYTTAIKLSLHPAESMELLRLDKAEEVVGRTEACALVGPEPPSAKDWLQREP